MVVLKDLDFSVPAPTTVLVGTGRETSLGGLVLGWLGISSSQPEQAVQAITRIMTMCFTGHTPGYQNAHLPVH